MDQNSIQSTGFTVVFEPEDIDPIADIIFVHGLQGHPYKTWTCTARTMSPRKKTLRSRLKRVLVKPRSHAQTTAHGDGVPSAPTAVDPSEGTRDVFWPFDLLKTSKVCCACRILTWGYDSNVAARVGRPVNKNSLFGHAKDLFYSLKRQREVGRPLIFVAHSLGGILVKETLALSDASDNATLKDIVESTSAVMFMGTPHRGGGEYAAIGDLARRVAAICLVDTNPALLDTLGLRSSDLERCQESFSKIWRKHGFTVKSFQEGLPLTGVDVPGTFLNKTVVPPHSSLLGDDREQGETLQANHMNMCRFSGLKDPNYIKVCGELEVMCKSIFEAVGKVAQDMQEVRKSLAFPEMDLRSQIISPPLGETCRWSTVSDQYQSWVTREDVERTHGLLWIKGKPGSGKSTLMNYLQSNLSQPNSNIIKASFFFNGRGTELEGKALGLWRSLTNQLLRHFPLEFKELQQRYQRKTGQGSTITWYNEELKAYLTSILTHRVSKGTSTSRLKHVFLFIDGLDECQGGEGRNLVEFFRQLTNSAFANGSKLNVCISSQSVLDVTISPYQELVVEDNNGSDIEYYVHKRLESLRESTEGEVDSKVWHALERNVVEKAAGVFLWVALVVDILLGEWDKGRSAESLSAELDHVPLELSRLYQRVLKGAEGDYTMRLFQWVIFSLRPLRISEWSQVMAFVYNPTKDSLVNWAKSPYFTENEVHLEKRIRSLSHGLVEVKDIELSQYHRLGLVDETDSLIPGAGSFTMNKVVQVIHSSVREFFLHGDGFAAISPTLPEKICGQSHMLIANACITYAASEQLRPFVEARLRAPAMSVASSARISFELNRDSRSGTGLPLSLRGGSSRISFGTSASSGYAISIESRVLYREIASKPKQISRRLRELWRYMEDSSKPPKFARISREFSSVSTKLLQTFPPFLQYASEMFEYHIIMADDEGMNPEPILRRLLSGGWEYWYPLREDIAKDTTLLYYAAEIGLASWVRYTLASYCDSFTPGGHLMYPILIAARRGNLEALSILLGETTDWALRKMKDHRQRNIFHHALLGDNIGVLEIIINHCQELSKKNPQFNWVRDCANAADYYGQTPLHIAAIESSPAMVQRLVVARASMGIKDNAGNTPLHLACLRESMCIEVCKVMLDFGASLTGMAWGNKKHQTPQVFAQQRQATDLVALLDQYLPPTPEFPAASQLLSSRSETNRGRWSALVGWFSS